jgi:transposase
VEVRSISQKGMHHDGGGLYLRVSGGGARSWIFRFTLDGRARWTALMRCFDDGRLALDNNPVERALRCVAIGRKNYLFAGSDAGGRRAAAIYSLIESAKLNGLNPQHHLADVLVRIADHPARRIAELLPWNWQPLDATRAAA